MEMGGTSTKQKRESNNTIQIETIPITSTHLLSTFETDAGNPTNRETTNTRHTTPNTSYIHMERSTTRTPPTSTCIITNNERQSDYRSMDFNHKYQFTPDKARTHSDTTQHSRSISPSENNNITQQRIRHTTCVSNQPSKQYANDYGHIYETPERPTTSRSPSSIQRIESMDARGMELEITHSEASTSRIQNSTTDSKRGYFTFIIHNRHFNDSNIHKFTTQPGNQPQFTSYNHGDHQHITFFTQTATNATRCVKRICNFLQTKPGGVAEAYSSLQRIWTLEKFISYLLRKGISTYVVFGTGASPNLLNQLFMSSNQNIEITDTDFENCNQYIDQKKELKNQNQQYQITKRSNLIEYIEEQIEIHNPQSYKELKTKLPKSIQLQLLKDHGTGYINIIKQQIEIHCINQKQQIKEKSYLQQLKFKMNILDYCIDSIQYIHNILLHNKIQPVTFLLDIILIMDMFYQKVNALVFQGSTNTGKSLFAQLILQSHQPEIITREKDRSSFHYDDLPFGTSVIFEEPIIDNTTVGTWKLLLEGSTIKCDQKHSNKEPIHRLPIILTSNSDIWTWVDTTEKEPLQQRIILYKLNKTITSMKDTKQATIPKSKRIITQHDFFAYIIYHIEEIYQAYQEITSKNPSSIHFKPTPDYIWQDLIEANLILDISLISDVRRRSSDPNQTQKT